MDSYYDVKKLGNYCGVDAFYGLLNSKGQRLLAT